MYGTNARILASVLFLAGCATASVDMDEPRRVVGTESAVRVDAEMRVDDLRPGSAVPVTYEISNQRPTPIAVADILPVTTFDEETRTFTLQVGSEVPGESTLPRLILIAPGERKAFTTTARLTPIRLRSQDPTRPASVSIRLKVNFLGETAPFADLIAMEQKAVVDPARADALFPVWVEKNEVVYTNSLPVRVGESTVPVGSPARRTPF